jgi:hypothetical protein
MSEMISREAAAAICDEAACETDSESARYELFRARDAIRALPAVQLDAAVKAERDRCIKIVRDEQRRLVPKRRTAHHEQTTICDDCGNASLAHSLAVWTEDGASYCPSCRPEIAASPIRKGE